MKKITLTADADLVERARLIARSQHKTLNTVFREWLTRFTGQAGSGKEFQLLMRRLRHVEAGRRFDRNEMNER